MDPKIGLYICKGCDIAASIDVDKLVGDASGKVAVCKTHDVLCSQSGIDLIKNDVGGEQLNRVVVAACSGRVFPELFEFGDGVLTDRVNLREQVAWCHSPNDEDTQMLAEDYVNMGIVKLTNSAPPEACIEETSRDILVIGGGVTGMTAAKAAAAAGYKVHLVEKEGQLGGWANRYHKVFPKRPPYQEPEDPDHGQLIEDVESNPNITVYKSTTVARTSGQPGKFKVALQNGNQSGTLTIGAIIQATGWKPYDPDRLGKWGYGASPDVITNIRMEEMA
ncbi:MAG: FAD-dependent oxidoreductase, partial [Candidatus Zixiibacteriota bacterium]